MSWHTKRGIQCEKLTTINLLGFDFSKVGKGFTHLFPVPGAGFGEWSRLFLPSGALRGGFVLQELSSELCVDLAKRLVALLLFLEANL